mgnify:CR=1 FL=1
MKPEARKKGLNIKVNKLPVAAIPRARTLGDTNGLFKVVVDADTDKIFGLHVVLGRNRVKSSTGGNGYEDRAGIYLPP